MKHFPRAQWIGRSSCGLYRNSRGRHLPKLVKLCQSFIKVLVRVYRVTQYFNKRLKTRILTLSNASIRYSISTNPQIPSIRLRENRLLDTVSRLLNQGARNHQMAQHSHKQIKLHPPNRRDGSNPKKKNPRFDPHHPYFTSTITFGVTRIFIKKT